MAVHFPSGIPEEISRESGSGIPPPKTSGSGFASTGHNPRNDPPLDETELIEIELFTDQINSRGGRSSSLVMTNLPEMAVTDWSPII